MKLSEANYKIVQPLVYVSRVFAICPVTFHKIGSSYQIKYSSLLVLYSYTIVIACGIGTIMGVKTDMAAGQYAIRMKSKKNKYISVCDMAVVFIIALYGIISIPYRMKMFVKMLDIWSHIDNVIPIVNYRKYRRTSLMFLLTTVLLTTLLFIFDIFIYCYQWSFSSDPTYYLQLYIFYYLLYYILIFQEIFFWHLVFFIRIRLVTLNENLRKLKDGFKRLFVIPYSMSHVGIFKEDVEKSTLMSSSYGVSKMFGKNTAERIEELLKIYGKIRQSVEILNDSPSYGLVQILLSCLLHLVVTPYFLLMEVFKNNASYVFILLQGVWLLVHIGRLLILVEPCQKCLDEYKTTMDLIFEMSLMDFDTDTKKALRAFAAMFSYADINFHACGFFKIDRSLLTAICGAVSTYLVILFQFQENVSN